MADATGYEALTRTERDRLERFAAAFEDVDPLSYDQFAGATASDDEIDVARGVALQAIGHGSRRKALDRAVRSFADAAERAISRRALPPQVMFTGVTQSIRVEDRVRFFESLERAVVAVALWDELDDTEREVLLGPWVRVAGRAIRGWA